MFTLGSDYQYPDWEGMWKHELSRDDTNKPKGVLVSGTTATNEHIALFLANGPPPPPGLTKKGHGCFTEGPKCAEA